MQKKIHETRKDFLYNKFKNIYQKYEKSFSLGGDITDDCPIWVLWWQGVDNAPEIIRYCIKSISYYAGKHKVNIITKDNYEEYVELPHYIIEQFNNGNIIIAVLSDIIRMSLLAKYGGIWMDATLFLTGNLFEKMNGYNFYSLKHEPQPQFVSQCRWTSYCLATGKNNDLFSLVREVFLEYFKHYDMLLDYLLLDHIIGVAVDKIPEVTQMINAVPQIHNNVEKLKDILSLPYNETTFNELTKNDCVFKLGWRDEFLITNNNLPTFYKVVIMNKWKE